MSNIKTGGQAFPLADFINDEVQNGMTLRDYFAAKTLNGLLSDGAAGRQKKEWLVRTSYEVADAMLKEREK